MRVWRLGQVFSGLRFRTRLALVLFLTLAISSGILFATYIRQNQRTKAYVAGITSDLLAISQLTQAKLPAKATRTQALEAYMHALTGAGLSSITVASPTGEVIASTNPHQVARKSSSKSIIGRFGRVLLIFQPNFRKRMWMPRSVKKHILWNSRLCREIKSSAMRGCADWGTRSILFSAALICFVPPGYWSLCWRAFLQRFIWRFFSLNLSICSWKAQSRWRREIFMSLCRSRGEMRLAAWRRLSIRWWSVCAKTGFCRNV